MNHYLDPNDGYDYQIYEDPQHQQNSNHFSYYNPPLPSQQYDPSSIQQKMSQMQNTYQSLYNNSNNIKPINYNYALIDNLQPSNDDQILMLQNLSLGINKSNSQQNTLLIQEDVKSNTLDNNDSVNNNDNNDNNFYLVNNNNSNNNNNTQTESSYRQTLNPAIYNAYRGIGGASGGMGNGANPAVKVIESTYYKTPQNARIAQKKQDRFDKTSLYKTELCTNWMLTGSCTYGSKCHFAHGVDDLKPRMRVENYKTQPCCDPAREGCRRCMYGRRCNYCHPGEAIRRPHPRTYYDRDYYGSLKHDFGADNDFPFGIYI